MKRDRKPAAPLVADEHKAVIKEKYIALWAGVAFFMALILIVWIATIKEHIMAITPQENVVDSARWDEFLTDFQDVLEETKDSVTQVRSEIEEISEDKSADEAMAGEVRGARATNAVTPEYGRQRAEVEKILYQISRRLESK